MIRLQKYLSECGIASRRQSEEIILAGKVKVNGEVVRVLGTKIDENNDVVLVNNKLIRKEKEKIYIMLNKPIGYITTVDDEFGRDNVIDLVPELAKYKLFPVGRLDKNTEGLLILTNDGQLTYRLTHPKHIVHKKYIAHIKGVPTKDEIKRFEEGLKIENYVTSPAKFKILKLFKNSCSVEIIIYEGKNRQIRKMCQEIGHAVINLKRVSIGNINLSNLPLGKWRYLTPKELESLKS